MTKNLRVLKYGGSSLATPDHIRDVAEQIAAIRKSGEDVVVIASAMGGTTAELISLAGAVSDSPAVRELDKLLSTGEFVSTALLCMALQQRGIDAVSLTGAQCGIRTSDEHYNARVEKVDPHRMRRELSEGRVVIAAGFQGQNDAGEVTTLGLGGSDTSAVVLASALDARRCEICSDVDGVYSADPRVVTDAGRIDEISYDEMIEMARHGASVLNPRAVQYARDHHVEIYSRSTFEPERPGTLIHDISPENPRVIGIAGHDELLPLVVESGAASTVCPGEAIRDELDEQEPLVDYRDPETGRREILIPGELLPDVHAYGTELENRFGKRVRVEAPRSSVSAIGIGVGANADARRTSRQYFEKAGIDLHNDYSAKHAVTYIVEPEHASTLMNVLHRQYDCPAEAAA